MSHARFSIVASKSGTTLEPNILMDYFLARSSAAVGTGAGRNFVAITDPGSQLQKTAEENGFRRIFSEYQCRRPLFGDFQVRPGAACGERSRRTRLPRNRGRDDEGLRAQCVGGGKPGACRLA
jgi:hypothetical protein